MGELTLNGETFSAPFIEEDKKKQEPTQPGVDHPQDVPQDDVILPPGYDRLMEAKAERIRNGLQYMENPEEEFERYLAADYVAQMLNKPTDLVYQNFDVYAQEYSLGEVPAKSFWYAAKDEWKRGQATIETCKLGLKMLVNPYDPELYAEYNEAISNMPLPDDGDRNIIEKSVLAAGQIAPSMGYAMANGLATGLLGGAIGGIAGFYIGGPGVAAAGAKGGYSLGARIGGAKSGFTLGAGGIFADVMTTVDPESGKPLYELIQPGENGETAVEDPEQILNIARAAAVGGGTISAALEALMPSASRLTGLTTEALETIGQKALKGFLKGGTAGRIVGRFIGEYGLNIAEETLQEVAQEVAELGARELAKAVMNESGMNLEMAKGQEWWDTIKDTAIQTASGTAVLGVFGASVQAYREGAAQVTGEKPSQEIFRTTGGSTKIQLSDIDFSGNVDPQSEGYKLASQAYDEAVENSGTIPPLKVIKTADGFQSVDNDMLQVAIENGLQNVEIEVVQSAEVAPGVTRGKTDDWRMSFEQFAASQEDFAQRETKLKEIKSVEDFQYNYRMAMPDADDNTIQMATAMMEVEAEIAGKSFTEYMSSTWDPAMFKTSVDLDGNKAAITFGDDGKGVIHLSKNSDFSSFYHETGHMIRRRLPQADQRILLDYYQTDSWVTESEEKFVRDLENYAVTGKAPNSKLQELFHRISRGIKKIWDRIGRTLPSEVMPAEVKAVFDRIYDPQGNIAADQTGPQLVAQKQQEIVAQEEYNNSVESLVRETDDDTMMELFQPLEDIEAVEKNVDKKLIKILNAVTLDSDEYDKVIDHIGAVYGKEIADKTDYYVKERRIPARIRARIDDRGPGKIGGLKAGEKTQPPHLIPFKNLTGLKINGTADLANLFQVMRDPTHTISHLVYVNEKNEIVAHVGHSLGLPTSAGYLSQNQNKYKEAVEKYGAKKVYVVENHPSGDPKPSAIDHERARAERKNLGDAFGGHVIMDHNTYSVMQGVQDRYILQEFTKEGKDFTTRRKDNPTIGDLIAARAWKEAVEENTTIMVGLDRQTRLNFWEYAKEGVNQLEYANKLKESTSLLGILVTNDEPTYTRERDRLIEAKANDENVLTGIILLDENGKKFDEYIADNDWIDRYGQEIWDRGEGPDLTNRIALLAEKIESDPLNNLTQEDIDELVKNYELESEDALEEFIDYDLAEELAEDILNGRNPRIIEAYVSLKNPVVIGAPVMGNANATETYFDFSEEYNEETEEYGEPEGGLVDLFDAIRSLEGEWEDYTPEKVIDDILNKGDVYENGTIAASDLESIMRDSDGIEYAYDENGEVGPGEIISAIFAYAGFDGIIDNTVNKKFGSDRKMGKSMDGMYEDTFHVIAFEPTQVKATENNGTWNPKDPRLLYQSAGLRSKTIDKSSLLKYLDLERQGVEREWMEAETGWWRGPDGKLRYEIDSEKVEFTEKLIEDRRFNGALKELLDYPELFRAYPDMEDLFITLNIDPNERDEGTYTPFLDRSNEGLFNIDEEINITAKTKESAKDSIIHEIQHAIQSREEYSKGGSYQSFYREMKAENEMLDHHIKSINRSMKEALKDGDKEEYQNLMSRRSELVNKYLYPDEMIEKAFKAYLSLPGEIEARVSERRANMTIEQKSIESPYETAKKMLREEGLYIPSEPILFQENNGLPNEMRAKHKQIIRNAVEEYRPVPRDVLVEYQAEQWAQKELQRRTVLEKFSWVKEMAVGMDSWEEFRDYFNTMAGEEERAAIKELNTQNEERFFKEIWGRANLKTRDEADANIIEQYANPKGIMGLAQEVAISFKEWKGSGMPGPIWTIANNLTYQRKTTGRQMENALKAIKEEPTKLRTAIASVRRDEAELMQLDMEEEIEAATPFMVKANRMTAEQRIKEALKTDDLKIREMLLTGVGTNEESLQMLKREINARIGTLKGQNTKKFKELKTMLAYSTARMDNMEKNLNQTIKKMREERRDSIVQRLEEVKAAKQEIREANQRRKALAKMHDRMRWIAKDILRKPADNCDVEYKKEILELQRGIDKGFRRKSTAEEWFKRNEFYKKNPAALEALTEEDIDKIMKKPLNYWDMPELEELHSKINQLRSQGAKKREAYLEARRAEVRELAGKMAMEIAEGSIIPLPKFPRGSDDWKNWLKSSKRDAVKALTWRPSRILKEMAGENSTLVKYFWKQVNQGTDEVLRRTNERKERITQKMEKLGITFKDLQTKIKGKDGELTIDEIIQIYIVRANQDNMRAIIHGNKISNPMGYVNQLDPKYKTLGDAIAKDLEDNRERLAKVYEEDQNEVMGKVKGGYFPMIRLKDIGAQRDDVTAKDLMTAMGIASGYADRSSTKKRIDISDEFQKPIKMGATEVWMNHIEGNEHYIANWKHIKMMHQIRENEAFQTAVLEKYGDKFDGWFKKYVNDFANPTLYKFYEAATEASKVLRNNMAIAYLSFNLMTIAKQLPSAALFLGRVGPVRLMAAAGKFMTQPRKILDFINERDPQMKDRSMERILEELKQQQKSPVLKAINKVGQIGMAPISMVDKMATSIGWLAVYDANKGKGDEEAIRLAQEAVLETQPAARAKDLAELYRSHEALNWFTMFTNQINQQWNMITADIPAAIRQQQWGRAMGYMVGLAISMLSISVLSGWRPWEDEPEDFVKNGSLQLLKSVANTLPVVGKSVSSGIDGWWGTGVDPVPAASEIGKMVKLISELDIESMPKQAGKVAESLAVMGGVPIMPIKRGKKALDELKEGEIEAAFSKFIGLSH